MRIIKIRIFVSTIDALDTLEITNIINPKLNETF